MELLCIHPHFTQPSIHLLSRGHLSENSEKLIDIKESFNSHSQNIEAHKEMCCTLSGLNCCLLNWVENLSTDKVNGKRLISTCYYGLKQEIHMYTHTHTLLAAPLPLTAILFPLNTFKGLLTESILSHK